MVLLHAAVQQMMSKEELRNFWGNDIVFKMNVIAKKKYHREEAVQDKRIQKKALSHSKHKNDDKQDDSSINISLQKYLFEYGFKYKSIHIHMPQMNEYRPKSLFDLIVYDKSLN